ncbi:MAG TPA: ABC transporter permease [Actinomycetota bacterium]|nr:ABC transporter permease [Actinomycetota bacterium]
MAKRTATAVAPKPSLHRALKIVHRNAVSYRYYWTAIFTGFFEPLFYLGAVGFGVGQFVGTVPVGGAQVDYATFLAPGMLAASTLNGAIADGFFFPFFKLNWLKTYEGILATPLNVPDIAVGEMLWAQLRGTIYSAGFLVVMLALGLIESPWGILALPAAMLSAGALSAGAMILTGLAKHITSLEKVMTLVVFPLFLFSGTFFPVELYPDALRPIVQVTPLYHSASLLRSLTTGVVGVETLVNLGYLLVMYVAANLVAIRLMRKRLIA